MGTKTRGINAERQLIHLFWANGFAASRIAGSGSSHYPSADIIVGNKDKKFVIECKITTKDKKYFSKDEIDQFKEFSDRFGADPYIAIRFFRTDWIFVELNYLKETGKFMVLSKEIAMRYGINIKEL